MVTFQVVFIDWTILYFEFSSGAGYIVTHNGETVSANIDSDKILLSSWLAFRFEIKIISIQKTMIKLLFQTKDGVI